MWCRHLLRQTDRLYRSALTGWSCRSTGPGSPKALTGAFSCSYSGGTVLMADYSVLPEKREVPSSHLSSAVERGAYDERFHQHTQGTDVTNVQVESDGKQVSIVWEDGKVSRFHSVWLRHMCFCPACRMDHTGQMQVEFDTISQNSSLASATDDGSGCLEVHWKEDPKHIGIFPLKFLKANCYSRQSLQDKRDRIRMTFSKDNSIPRFQYDEVMSSQQGVYRWVKALNETGIALVQGVPCQPGMVKQVCQQIAKYVQHTIYGEIFDVRAEARPINAAYSTGELKLHMDQIQYESPPGIQALHCIKFDENIVGGDNHFVDLFQVAEEFREKYPEDFEVLSKVPVTYETLHYNRDWPVHMHYQRPTFTVNKHGDLLGVVWHPHLIGPLHTEEELVEPFFRAYGRLYTMVNNFSHYFRHRLQSGDLVSFNNRRVLHGRAGYSNQTGERHLQGCYVEISEFKSCVHMLSNLEGDGRAPIRVGDYDMQ